MERTGRATETVSKVSDDTRRPETERTATADKVEEEGRDADGREGAGEGLAAVGLDRLTRAVRAERDVVG